MGAESSFLLGQKFINLATLYTCWCGPESQKLQKLQSIRTSFVFLGFGIFCRRSCVFFWTFFPGNVKGLWLKPVRGLASGAKVQLGSENKEPPHFVCKKNTVDFKKKNRLLYSFRILV